MAPFLLPLAVSLACQPIPRCWEDPGFRAFDRDDTPCVSELGYRDGLIVIKDGVLFIKGYYFPSLLARKIKLSKVRHVEEFPVNLLHGRWRIWGSGDLRHWYNLDRRRSGKKRAFEFDLGGRVRPMVTPDEPERFAAALEAAGVPLRRHSA
jgi:hypothetical protein